MARVRLSNKDDVALLRYIKGYTKVNYVPPSIREIMRQYRFKSTSPAQHRLKRLSTKNYIDRKPGIARGLRITMTGYRAMKEYDEQVKAATTALYGLHNG